MSNLKIEKMRYQSNKLSYSLILLGLFLSIISMIASYRNTKNEANIHLGFDIIINIVFMLVVFLAAEKNKIYSKNWGLATVGLGIFNILRIFYVPLLNLNKGRIVFMFAKENGKIVPISFLNSYLFFVMFLITAGILMIFAGLITIEKSNKLNRLLKSEGN